MDQQELRRELFEIKETVVRTETWVQGLFEQKHETRISALERWRAGVVAAIAVIGAVVTWLLRVVL